jgi:glutamate:GABA antiporter
LASASPAPKRELGLRDVTLFAMAVVTTARWITPAAQYGAGSLAIWLITSLVFMIPLVNAIAALVHKHPNGGGLYRWACADFGPWHGFLSFWTYWMAVAIWFPSTSMFFVGIGVHMFGPSVGELGANRLFVLAMSVVSIWVALGTNLKGVNIGKWVENLGGLANWMLSLLLIAIGACVWAKRGSATPMRFIAHFDWKTVAFWSYMAFAMSGMELVGFMADEIREPVRTVRLAGWIAAGFAVLFYSCSTLAVLLVLPPAQITEMNGLVETGYAAGAVLQAGWLTPMIALLVLITGIGLMGGVGIATSRLPLAAGVDHLLPEVFGRIHPRWGTPHYSILILGAVGTFFLCLYQLGDTMRAAYQELVSLMVIVTFIPYLYIFASAWRAGKRVSAVSGLVSTLIVIVFSFIPTAEIRNVWLFEAKIFGGTIGVLAAARFFYLRRTTRGFSRSKP